MKLKLRLGQDKKKQVTEELERIGVTISEDSELTLTEDRYHEDELYCRDDTDRVVVALSEILYIESLGKEAIEQAEDAHKDDGDASSFISDIAVSSGSVTIIVE